MKLKKKGDLIYAYIKMFSSKELTQLKGFLKFEHANPSPYLDIVNLALEFTSGWNFKDSFPEKELKEKCEKNVLKNFAKHKHALKQSIENFVSYLGITDQSEIKANFYFYKRAFLINYHYYYKLGLYGLGYEEMENIAKEAFELGHFDFSEILYRNMNFFTSYAFSDPLDAIAENKRIREIYLNNKGSVDYHTDIIHYLQLFYNAANLTEDSIEIIKEDIKAFEKISRDDSKVVIALNHLLAEVFVSTATNDFQRDLDSNLKIVDFFNKHKDKIPIGIMKNKFSAIFNASLAARKLLNEEVSNEMLEEARLFLENNLDLDAKTRKRFYFFLLSGRVDHSICFEKDSTIILKNQYAIDEAIANNEVELTSMQEWSRRFSSILCFYITENFESSYELSYKYYTEYNFPLTSIICHILSQYHLFDADFLTYSYRNIARHLDTKAECSKEERSLLKKLMNLLKKGKVTKEEVIKVQILEIIEQLKNRTYILGHKCVAKVFERNFR